MRIVDLLYYIFYKAYQQKAKRRRWYSTTRGRKADTLRAFTAIITFYSILAAVFLGIAFKATWLVLEVYPMFIIGLLLLMIIFFIDRKLDRRYTYEKLLQMDEKFEKYFTNFWARVIVAMLIVAPFVSIFLLSGKK